MATSFCNQFEFVRQRFTYDLFSLCSTQARDIIANIKCYLTETNNVTRLGIIKLNGALESRFIRGHIDKIYIILVLK